MFQREPPVRHRIPRQWTSSMMHSDKVLKTGKPPSGNGSPKSLSWSLADPEAGETTAFPRHNSAESSRELDELTDEGEYRINLRQWFAMTDSSAQFNARHLKRRLVRLILYPVSEARCRTNNAIPLLDNTLPPNTYNLSPRIVVVAPTRRVRLTIFVFG